VSARSKWLYAPLVMGAVLMLFPLWWMLLLSPRRCTPMSAIALTI
jgi:hypothetical protein